MNETDFPVLYILMRTDLSSMNPGKGMAQAAHAANAFMRQAPTALNLTESVSDWENATSQGFGTTIVLGGNIKKIEDTVKTAKSFGLIADLVRDPSYPVRDGEVIHLIDLITCAYVFGNKNDFMLRELTRHYHLHP